jgi:hypothetical protein
MRSSSAMTRRIRRALVVCALVAGVAAMHHVGTATPDAEVAAPTAVAGAAVHSLADVAAAPSGAAAHYHPAAERAAGAAVAAGPTTTGHVPGHGATGPGYDLLHLCLAVAVSAVLALLGLLLVRHGTLRWIVGRWTSALLRRPLFRPPRAVPGRALLLSVCVMRT